jgi:hypothetical protein
MKHLYRIVCNWLFSITKSLINWCISTHRWKWAAKIVEFRTRIAETSLYKLHPDTYITANIDQLMGIVSEKTDNPVIIQQMEITASNAYKRKKRAISA